MLDLEALIKGELLPLRLPSFVAHAREQQIAWRAYGFGAWRRGDLSFLECVRNLLPGRFKSPELQRKLQGLLDRELDAIFDREEVYRTVPTLFGNPFQATAPAAFKNWLVALRLINEIILQDEYRVRERISKEAVVIDAGANIGVFTVFSARIAKEGAVYAFEPTSATFESLQKNARPYGQVVVKRSALGNRIGQAELLVANSSGEGNTLTDSGIQGAYDDKEVVPITMIDAFVHEQKLSRVDFIKIDTEGFEKEILEGAVETIRRHRPALALSAYHKEGDPERLQALIKSICGDYRCELKLSPELDLICDAR
ncbi:MAG: FkbM family methyltransferase [Parcubacteria group bacterium]|nr:FkbM family methyltransferase [Parcubacteria group bacterium]